MADLASRITRPGASADIPVADAAVGDVPVGHASGQGLVESTDDFDIKLSALGDQTDNPLSNAATFEEMGLKQPILDGLYAHNFTKPSKIQERALPLLLSDPPRNMIAQSQSGTGKTAAFVITALSRVDFSQPNVPQALVLTNSRELALQIAEVFKQIGQFCEGLKVFAAVREDSKPEVEQDAKRDVSVQANVVVGTPGTVMGMLNRSNKARKKKLRHDENSLIQLDGSQMKLLIIDEADIILSTKNLSAQAVHVKNTLGELFKSVGRKLDESLQVLLFSATFEDGKDGKDGEKGAARVMRLAEMFAPNANQMRLRQQELTVRGIQQMFMDCTEIEQKYEVLCKLYGLLTTGSSIIFVGKKRTADALKDRMQQDGHQVTSLHGDLPGAERDRVLEDFRTGKSKVLIATNVMARGIDVASVSMVINYDLPTKGSDDDKDRDKQVPDPDTYLHRIGRTGRFGRVGVSITFIHDRHSYIAMDAIAKYFGIDVVMLDPKDWEETETTVKKVIKSARAQADYRPGMAEGAAAENV